MSADWSYEDAVSMLLSLEPFKSFRQRVGQDRIAGKRNTTLEDMEKYLLRIGIPLERLDTLSVIHVAGTKGKGSTCAMCESVVRRRGLRTGLFTGPHLLTPRERLRLGGRPLAPPRFAACAQRVHSLLRDTQEDGSGMPDFFSFMTCMAFLLFLEEQVDVAVVEVGCGGEYDATNILRNVCAVGITSLGLDHTEYLGASLAEVAAAKAGVLKRGCRAYTAPQPALALNELIQRARELDCPLSVVPELSWHRFPAGSAPRLPADVPSYRQNAALALQLTTAWLRERLERHMPRLQCHMPRLERHTPRLECHMPRLERHMSREAADGLTQFRWPGRYHIVDEHYAKFYLDLAHTKESIEVCAQWFSDHSDSGKDKILVFSCSPDRKVETFFPYLVVIPFKTIYFVEEYEGMVEKYTSLWNKTSSGSNIVGLDHVQDFLNTIKRYNEKPAVLVTGSLLLIRDLLSILDPHCTTR